MVTFNSLTTNSSDFLEERDGIAIATQSDFKGAGTRIAVIERRDSKRITISSGLDVIAHLMVDRSGKLILLLVPFPPDGYDKFQINKSGTMIGEKTNN